MRENKRRGVARGVHTSRLKVIANYTVNLYFTNGWTRHSYGRPEVPGCASFMTIDKIEKLGFIFFKEKRNAVFVFGGFRYMVNKM